LVENTIANVALRSQQLDLILTTSGVTITADAAAAPDGTTTAEELAFAAGTSFCYQPRSFSVNTYTTSLWVRAKTGTTKIRLQIPNDNSSDQQSSDLSSTTTFARLAFTNPVTGSTSSTMMYRNDVAGDAADVYAWGAQLEISKYPTSYIPTTTAAVFRSVDVLACTSVALASPFSYADWTIHYRPNYAATETSVDHDLIFWDSTTRLYFRQSDAKFVLHSPGSADVVSAAQNFAREADMTIRIVHSSTAKSLTVNGVTVTGSVGTTLAASTTIYVLGNASGAQECGDLVTLQLDWAA
jgi:hypothetical protein